MLELEYLRNEMNQRINHLYEYPHKVLGHLVLLWGGTLALSNISHKNFMEDTSLFFMVSTIFFISAIIVRSFSNRDHENLNQIFKIAAYNTIFYEGKSCIKKDDIFSWELATFKMTLEEIKNHRKLNYINYNMDEYFVCSLIATGVNTLLLILFILKLFPNLESMPKIDILMISLCFIYIIVSVILSIIIRSNTTLNFQKWLKIKKDHLKSFIEYAREIKYYTEEEVKERFGEDFLKEIYK